MEKFLRPQVRQPRGGRGKPRPTSPYRCLCLSTRFWLAGYILMLLSAARACVYYAGSNTATNTVQVGLFCYRPVVFGVALFCFVWFGLCAFFGVVCCRRPVLFCSRDTHEPPAAASTAEAGTTNVFCFRFCCCPPGPAPPPRLYDHWCHTGPFFPVQDVSCHTEIAYPSTILVACLRII